MTRGRLAIVAALAAAIATACSSSDEAKSGNGNCGAPSMEEIPDDLACTGLYSDFKTKAIAPTARPYGPAVPFWSDGLDKDRYISLPPGTKIDDSNPDDWKFPVGTKLWKDMHKGATKVETRYFTKVSEDTWLKGSYVWAADGQSAKNQPGADVMVEGQPYHVPTTLDCDSCHHGRKDRILGFEAISLGQAGATGLTLAQLNTEGVLQPPPSRTTVTLPDPALGILHANCGITCHNDNSGATAYQTKLHFRLGFDEVPKPVEQWDLWATAVNQKTTSPGRAGDLRIDPGKPESSEVIKAMSLRGDGQMPPIATKVVDQKSVDTITAWIKTLH
jgi:hypothetical protein